MRFFITQIKIELERHVKNSTRLFWSLGYLFIILIYTIYALVSGQDLGNFLSESEFQQTLFRFIILIYIQTLPVLVLVLTYDSLIQDPTIKIAAVAAVNRKSYFVGKLISIFLITYLIYILGMTISYIFLILIYGNSSLFNDFMIKSNFVFIVVILFFIITSALLILVINHYSRDRLSTITLPVLIYYVIPFLISSSLSFQILHPYIQNLSPIIWISQFSFIFIYSADFTVGSVIFLITLLISLLFLNKIIDIYEFE